MLKDHVEGVYRIARPQAGETLPLVFDSPHSGRLYPDSFGFACDLPTLRRAEDSDVDALFAHAPGHGASLLCAEFPRTFIDVNRDENDIDPEVLSGPLPDTANPSPRSYAGIGLVRRLVRPGLPVYDRTLSLNEIQQRIDSYYKPYHAALASLIEQAHYNYGVVWHVDCHSMPSNGGQSLRSVKGTTRQTGQPDFVLGDRDGTSCAPAFTQAVRDFLQDAGYRVTVNHPYKGVELVRRHGRPKAGYHSLQIEINKALYWNEAKNESIGNYNALKGDIDKLIAFLSQWSQQSLTAVAAD